MKYTTTILYFATVACSAGMAASTASSSSSIIKCQDWEGLCRTGTTYSKSDTRCKDRFDSIMACVDLCCKPLVAPSPSPKPRSIIECKEWDGHCSVGTDYDRSEKDTRCKDRSESTMACVDLCCKPLVAPSPSPKPQSIIKCKEWDGNCRVGTDYYRNEKDTRCKDRSDSTMACVDLCCKPLVAPSPSAKPSSVIKCKEWNGNCRLGTYYDLSEKNTRCKDRTSSTMACVDECCKPLVAPTPPAKPSIIKCKDWEGRCRIGTYYDQKSKDTRCKDRTNSTMACVDMCCKPQ